MLNLVPPNVGGQAEILVDNFFFYGERTNKFPFPNLVGFISLSITRQLSLPHLESAFNNYYSSSSIYQDFLFSSVYLHHSTDWPPSSWFHLSFYNTALIFESIYNKFYVSLNISPALVLTPLYCLNCHNFLVPFS